MSAASHYWHWVKINAQAKRIIEPVPEAKAFMQQQFPALLKMTDSEINQTTPLPGAEIQRYLFQQMQSDPDEKNRQMAECCLRCFISNYVDWICRNLAENFGQKGQFSYSDLLPLVLDDTEVLAFRNGRSKPSGYQSIATRALQTFTPGRSQLSTWTRRLVVSNPEMSRFLADQGIYLQTQWSILNSKNAQFLQRRLDLAPHQLQFFTALLESYHAVYQRDWLKIKASKNSKCPSPTTAQLAEIAELLQARSGTLYSPEDVLDYLNQLADYIRAANCPKAQAMDDEEYRRLIDEHPAPAPAEDEPPDEFLVRYRQQFNESLTKAIGQAVLNRYSYFQKRDPAEAEKFLKGLFLFHCRAIAMTKLETCLQKKQYQVSRLLQLPKLREDVKRDILVLLRAQVRELAAEYVTLEQLEQLMEKIDAALEDQIDQILIEAASEAATGKRDLTKPRSLFSTFLCRHLDDCTYFDIRSLEP